MNRQQRRAAERNAAKTKKKPTTLSYNQGVAIAQEAYRRGQDVADTTHAKIFMYAVGLMIKVLHQKWGWGYVRLGRLVNQLLEEYNENDMDAEEIQQWCWEYGGFKLSIDD